MRGPSDKFILKFTTVKLLICISFHPIHKHKLLLTEPSKPMSEVTYSEATMSFKLVLQVTSCVQTFQHQGQHEAPYVHRLTNSSAAPLINSDRPGALSHYHVFVTQE